MDKETYTVEECAKVLGIGRISAYAAIKRGEIPAIRIGRRLIVPKSAMEEYLRSAADKVA